MFRHRMKGLSSNTLLTLVVGAVVVAILSIFLFRVAMANVSSLPYHSTDTFFSYLMFKRCMEISTGRSN